MATSPDNTEDDLQPEYDFRTMRGVVRGKYSARYRERLRVIRLADDVAGAFADERAVNEAPREYPRVGAPKVIQPNQLLQQTGHANNGSLSISVASRVN